MIIIRFYLFYLCGSVSCHLCLLDPVQRGGLPEVLVPDDDACFKTRMCSKESGKIHAEYSQGNEIEISYQKNANEYNSTNPGIFQIWFSEQPSAEMKLMGMFKDDDSPELTIYTRKITLPDKPLDNAVIMVEYDPHNSNGRIYYQCADIKITGGEGEDVCLPLSYEVFVEVLRDEIHNDGHHHDEYKEGDHLHIWVDGDAKKSLVHSYVMERNQRRVDEHHVFLLRDYNKGLQWRGHWNHTTQTVTYCKLSFLKIPFERYCLGRKVHSEGSGTLGRRSQVDYWNTTYEETKDNLFEEIHLTTEKGNMNAPILEVVKGKKDPDITWMEFREFHDMSTRKVDPTVFYVPESCPH